VVPSGVDVAQRWQTGYGRNDFDHNTFNQNNYLKNNEE
jgi:hypothetical protein